MIWETALLFTITVLPLICTPGPDILYVASQGLSGGQNGAMRAVAGILLGYSIHGVLSALGVAALVAASPVLFTALKLSGVGYLAFLSIQMLWSACIAKDVPKIQNSRPASLWRGFLTSFLNPKGLLMYFAVLPQFITPEGSTIIQSVVLSTLFIAGCATVYSAVGLLAAGASGKRVVDKSRRRLEAFAGVLLAGAATKIATQ